MKISVKHILFFSFVVVLMFSSCSTNEALTKLPAESTDQIAAAETLKPTFTPIPIMTLTSAVDVSEWIVKIGEQECRLIPFGNEYPGWHMADCPEQLWFPIGQTTITGLDLLDNKTCPISTIDDFEIAIQDLSIDALPVEFIQIEDDQWGCQIPYCDTAGIEVVCGFECRLEGFDEEIRVLIFGKTKRDYLKGENEGANGFDDGNGNSSGEEEPPPIHQD